MTAPLRAKVLTVSDGVVAGTRQDRSGAALADALAAAGFEVAERRVVADGVETVAGALRDLAEGFSGLVVTTGGTGFAPRDVTPEATRPLLEREAPGIVEALRRTRQDQVATTILSRGVAGTVARTFVLNLPGSPGAVRDGVAVLAPVVGHLVAQLRGGGDH